MAARPKPRYQDRGPATEADGRAGLESEAADLLGELPSAGASSEADSSPVAAYERELRDRLASSPTQASRSPRRLLRYAIPAALLLVAAILASQRGEEREQRRREEALRFIAAAGNGLARDTRSAYAASADALSEALALAPDRSDAKAMLAQVLATLSLSYGTGRQDLERAVALLEEADPSHESALQTRWLLAADEEKRRVEDEILLAAEEGGTPPIQSLAGAILLERGNPSLAIERFNAAMQGMPGHVPTLVRIGDSYRARREFAEAGRYYDLSLAIAEDHVGALVGAADSRLGLRADRPSLEAALADLRRIRGEEQVPIPLRQERLLAEARIHLALGDPGQARERLALLGTGLPEPRLARSVVEALLQAGDPARANALFESFLPTRASDPRLREAWLRALLAKEDHRKAVSLPLGEGERELRVLQGIAWLRLGDLGKARSLMRSATVEGKLPVEAIVHLAWMDWKEGRTERARKNLERFGVGPKARSSGSRAYAELLRAEGRGEEAMAVLEQAIERSPHAPALHAFVGRLLQERGRKAEAEAAFERALAINPFLSEARRGIATLRMEEGDSDGASMHWEALLEQKPGNPEALAGLALVRLERGELESARRLAEEALAAGPQEPAPHRAQARIHLATGALHEAERSLARAASLPGAGPDPWQELGEVRLMVGDAAGARGAFQAALRQLRGWIPPRIGIARSWALEGRGVLAVRQLGEILDGLPKEGDPKVRARAHAALGEAMLSQGKGFAVTAGKEAEKAFALAPDDPLALLVLASAGDATGDRAAAAGHLRRLMQIAPHLPAARIALGRHLREGGDAEGAAEAFSRYLDLAPRGPGAREARKELAALRR